jgi:hypothetical protein
MLIYVVSVGSSFLDSNTKFIKKYMIYHEVYGFFPF